MEDWEPGDEHRVGKLNLSLYGTRDAAQNWAAEYTGLLNSLGFVIGMATPCSFVHECKELFLTVHGDDFAAVGPTTSLAWLERCMEERYEIKSEYLGPEDGLKQEIRVLNRVLRWMDDGLEYEPDQRHAELIIRDLGMDGAKPVSTPATAETKDELEDRDKAPLMSPTDATTYRAFQVSGGPFVCMLLV